MTWFVTGTFSIYVSTPPHPPPHPFFQVRDYRNCNSEPENVSVIADEIPIVHKVCLRMTLENIVKDMPSIIDVSCPYGDLMVSSRFFILMYILP